MNLSFQQLFVFREVMRSGSISQAARSVGRTQPAVSTMMSNLENELGFALFLREQGKLVPTAEACYFLEEAEDVLARLERTKQTLSRIGSLKKGMLRIASHPAASGLFIPRLLTGFLKDREDVDISLIMRSSAIIEDLIASQQFDIGFAETTEKRGSVHQVDFDLECICVIAKTDPLARLDVITPKDLSQKPMAILFDEHPTASQTETAFLASGCQFSKRLELRTFLPGLQFVSEGFCLMVCDMITAYSYLHLNPVFPQLTMRRFMPRISNKVSILTPAYVSQTILAQAFSNHLTEAILSMQSDVESCLAKPGCQANS